MTRSSTGLLAAAAGLLVAIGNAGAAESEPEEELDAVVVTATRSGNLVRDEAIRVEVLPQEEIAENLTVQPGNLTSLLNELGGIRMQPTAPALGGVALQMRGMPGRHTLVLQDGLPLLGAQTDSFGLLQTPPLDLGRVELIKGVGSALYGASALGGVLNLVSRRPDGASELLVNRTSIGGTDLVGFATAGLGANSGFTLLAAANDQSHEDIDHDNWADIPSYRRYTVRPRFFRDGDGRSMFATLGYVDEDRLGGTLPGQTLPDGTSVQDGLKTQRLDGGLTFMEDLGGGRQLSSRWSGSRTDYTRNFEEDHVRSSLTSAYGEGTVNGRAGDHGWLLGVALQYEELKSADAPNANYSYVVPGFFVQDEFTPLPILKLAASARLDVHDDYGTFFSPRLSALIRPSEDLSIRASVGTGFAAPTPMLEKIESTSLARLDPMVALQAERASNASLDLKWDEGGWEVNASLFASRIRHPLALHQSPAQADHLVLVNEVEARRVTGVEMLVHRVAGPLHFIGSSTYLDATEADPLGGRRNADRVPRWSGELAALLEDESLGRIGIEVGYTGTQSLNENPYRTEGQSYFELGLLAEMKVGIAAIFFNANNLTNVRQSHYDPSLRPAPLPDGERVVDLWAPVAGRWFNLGVRLEL